MPTRLIFAMLFTAALCRIVSADDTYTLHENLHPDQKVTCVMTYACKTRSSATTNGNQADTMSETGQSWKVSMTIRAVKDGSATQAQVYIYPQSVDTTKIGNQAETKTPCPFAGKTIVVTRNPDETITNDLKDDDNSDDANSLNNFLVPDEDCYPDHPVAVGDVWDNSAIVAKHWPLGPKDQLKSVFRLDWVKTIDGRQQAQISNSIAVIYKEEGNVEEDAEYESTLVVDIASGMIIKGDSKNSSKYLSFPGAAAQVTGGTEGMFHSEVVSDAADAPTTKP